MKRWALALWFTLLFCAASYGGTITHYFSNGLGDKFVLNIDPARWSATTGPSGLTIQRTEASLTSRSWDMQFDLTKMTRTGVGFLAGDFSVTVQYSGYTYWKPAYEQQNQFHIINSVWGYLGGEYAYVMRNAENNWWTVPGIYPDAASRMIASLEGGGPHKDWGTARTGGTVTMTRRGDTFTMTADNEVIFSGTNSKLPIRPGSLGLWMSATLNGLIDLPQVTINSITITAPDICPDLDLDGNCTVDYEEFAILSGWWMSHCDAANPWCDGADVDFSGTVDMADLLDIAAAWLN